MVYKMFNWQLSCLPPGKNCSLASGGCEGQWRDTNWGVQCSCGTGWWLEPDGQSCGRQNSLAHLYNFFFLVFHLFKAAPIAYGCFLARGSSQSCSHWLMPEPQQCRIQAVSATYTTAQGNARSSTQWARPGIHPATIWLLVRFIYSVTWLELLQLFIFK